MDRQKLAAETDSLPLLKEELMQGYMPFVPQWIREVRHGRDTDYVVCFKSSGTLARKEIKISVSEENSGNLKT